MDVLAEREWTASNDPRILHSFTRRKDRGGRLILAVRPIPPLPASTSDVMVACPLILRRRYARTAPRKLAHTFFLLTLQQGINATEKFCNAEALPRIFFANQ